MTTVAAAPVALGAPDAVDSALPNDEMWSSFAAGFSDDFMLSLFAGAGNTALASECLAGDVLLANTAAFAPQSNTFRTTAPYIDFANVAYHGQRSTFGQANCQEASVAETAAQSGDISSDEPGDEGDGSVYATEATATQAVTTNGLEDLRQTDWPNAQLAAKWAASGAHWLAAPGAHAWPCQPSLRAPSTPRGEQRAPVISHVADPVHECHTRPQPPLKRARAAAPTSADCAPQQRARADSTSSLVASSSSSSASSSTSSSSSSLSSSSSSLDSSNESEFAAGSQCRRATPLAAPAGAAAHAVDATPVLATVDALRTHCVQYLALLADGARGAMRRALPALTCPACGKHVPRVVKMLEHLNTHTGERPFVCCHDGCGSSFTKKDNLRRHEREVHEGIVRKGRLEQRARALRNRRSLYNVTNRTSDSLIVCNLN